jgi:hypothetical protein
MTPPSTLSVAPLVAADAGEQMYTTMFAISSGVMKRWSRDVGRRTGDKRTLARQV